jgi:hypothetical protein
MLPLLTLLATLQAPATYDHVIAISIDGLRSDALTAADPGVLPAFERLRTGASTLNARTDPDYTVTLPNHAGMLTGRPTAGETGHGWPENGEPPEGATLALEDGTVPAGVFAVTSEHGVIDRLYASKSKFILFPRTWDDIDDYGLRKPAREGMDALLAALEAMPEVARSFTMLHLREPDSTGHEHGWVMDRGAPYMAAVRVVDAEIGRLFDWLDENPELRARTAIVLTADHGGGIPIRNHHGLGRQWVNAMVPFLLWTGDGAAAGDLYALNEGRRLDPSIRIVNPVTGAKAPIRNGEIGNLSLQLLGLPAIPGSVYNAAQDLRWTALP